MAKGFKTGGKNFPKGKSGNPDGRPPLPPDILAARRINRAEFERIANEFLYLTQAEVEARFKDPKTTQIERMIGSQILAAGLGDPKRFNCVMDRLLGKPRQETPPEEEKQATSFVQLVMEAEALKKKAD